MTNAERASYYRSLAALYDRLTALDQRQSKVDVLKAEQARIDATRKQVLAELEQYTKPDSAAQASPVPSTPPKV